jgi:hypothetical protein
MRRYRASFVFLLAACLAAQPILAGSATAARLIPTENGSLVIDGKEISPFKSEMPLPEGKLITCKGSCLVQARNVQLVPQDQSVFAVAETSGRHNLTVQSGRVDFAIGPESRGLTFNVPGQTLQAEKSVASATDGGVVRGYVSVTEKGAEIVVQEGALQVATAEGSQVIEPNRPLVMAMDKNGKVVAAGTAAAGLAAGGAGMAGASGGGGVSAGAAVAGGAVAAAGVAAGVAASADDGGRRAVSPTDINPSNLDTRPY